MPQPGLDPDLVKWLDGKFENLVSKLDESDRRASDSRRDVYLKLEEQGRAILDSQHQIEAVKKDVAQLNSSMDAAKPTLEEFSNMKAQATGAGRLGRFFWIVGGFVLFAAAWVVSRWDAILAGLRAFNGK
ncbi:hypothetical protein [Roseibium sediminicola]|uniref:Uncharacterized protein n=1 Tax=Roseibium sediminicola TaxID=2933272 RepID=A0ABT0H121_9HYPH|nr:hypothetical protein [Roseibium sp. CAU 1639]MCK7615165.1 hypothetical protein [Roseibium sp. CAU 1639]